MRMVVTHALTGDNGAITHEIEYVSVDLEPWENQITKSPTGNTPEALRTAAAAKN
jgi:hypothetical protein